LRANRVPLTGVAVFTIVFLVLYGVTQSPVKASFLAFLLGAAGSSVMQALYPYREETEEYNLDAQRRVRKALASIKRIKQLARDVHDEESRAALLRGCELIPELFRKTQERASYKVAPTAARVQSYLSNIELTVRTYLDVQSDPTVWPPNSLEVGHRGFWAFKFFAEQSMQDLNAGDVRAYEASVESLEAPQLLRPPTLSNSE
jgi:hypothetical protein